MSCLDCTPRSNHTRCATCACRAEAARGRVCATAERAGARPLVHSRPRRAAPRRCSAPRESSYDDRCKKTPGGRPCPQVRRSTATTAVAVGDESVSPMQLLSADQLEAIHLTSLRILEELGIELMSPRARDTLRAAGAEVDEASGTVRLDRALVAAALATAPSSFVLTPRNEARRITLGGQSCQLWPCRRAP